MEFLNYFYKDNGVKLYLFIFCPIVALFIGFWALTQEGWENDAIIAICWVVAILLVLLLGNYLAFRRYKAILNKPKNESN